jgi:hypothetical protein
MRYVLQIVEGSRVSGKLGQKYCRALDGLHGHVEFPLPNIRQLIYTSPTMECGRERPARAGIKNSSAILGPQRATATR